MGVPTTEVREEFAVLKQLDHPHVLRIFEAWRRGALNSISCKLQAMQIKDDLILTLPQAYCNDSI